MQLPIGVREVLRHALGNTGYRNHYVAPPGVHQRSLIAEAVRRGLMVEGPMHTFKVTEAGQKLVGIYEQP